MSPVSIAHHSSASSRAPPWTKKNSSGKKCGVRRQQQSAVSGRVVSTSFLTPLVAGCARAPPCLI
jgi:hypothetical protein